MTALCCNECFESIARKNPNAARLWLDVCAYRARYGTNFLLREEKVPRALSAFKRLEMMGFISTLDMGESVCVRVEGHRDCEECSCSTFCLKREEHGDNWDLEHE